MSIAQTTSERLAVYNNFSHPVIEAVAEVAERQASLDSYPDFLKSVGIVDLQPSSIVDIKPKECDPTEALVVHLSMANPLDANNLYSLGTLASLYPDRRIVAAANPSGIGFGLNTLSHSDRKKVANGDFTPVVRNVGTYLENERVTEIAQVGVSYGADLVLATDELDMFEVTDAVMIEPASVVARSMKKLVLDFKSSEAALKGYVLASGLEDFVQARKEKDTVSGNNYALGLARLTNIAVARGIAKGRFEEQLDVMLGGKPMPSDKRETYMRPTVVWGSESELCIDAAISEIINRMQKKHGIYSVDHLSIAGQKHAMTNDLHLYAAIVAESIGL